MPRLGRYELIQELGRGGMGVVWKALDPAINRTVAVKIIPLKGSDGTSDARQVKERVLREARAAGALSSHPGIVHVHDMGQEGDVAYVVMEYVEGTQLDKWIQAGIPAGREAQFVRILTDAATALDYAHLNGVIHRDVKPSNLIIQKDGSVKIMDFGIAKVSGTATITKTNMMLGSPFYMTPEQVLGQPVSGKTDQYSLGVIAYMMFAGRRPFEGGSFLDLFTKIVQENPPAIVGVKAEADAAIHRAMAKDPNARFSTCVEFVQALREAYLPRVAPPNVNPGKSRGGSNEWLWWGLAGLLAAVLIVGAAVFYQSQQSGRAEMDFWESVQDKKEIPLYQDYLRQYPNGKFASIARDRIDELKAAARSRQKGPSNPTPPPNSNNLEPAKLIEQVKPIYPASAQKQKIQGTVQFTARIGLDGHVGDLQLVSGPPELVDAAKAAVTRWRYQPGKLNGKAIETIATIDVNFSLN